MRFQTAPKPDNEALPSGMRPNEDALRADPEAGCFAVADGAGGTGIFSGQWAQYLLDQLPPTPIRTYAELTAWLDAIWEAFYVPKEAELQGDGIRRNKFYDEGSAATLLAIWPGKDGVAWMSYGDSNLLWISAKGEYKGSFPATQLHEFTAFPSLVNWNDTWMHPSGFRSGILQPDKGDQLLLATDALAQALLLWAKPESRHEKLPSGKIADLQACFREHPPQKSLLDLLEELNQQFVQTLRTLHTEGYLLNDDCTLVGYAIA